MRIEAAQMDASGSLEVIAANYQDNAIFVLSDDVSLGWQITYKIEPNFQLADFIVLDFGGGRLNPYSAKDDIAYLLKEYTRYNTVFINHYLQGNKYAFHGWDINHLTTGDIDGDGNHEVLFTNTSTMGFDTEQIVCLDLVSGIMEEIIVCDVVMDWCQLICGDVSGDGADEVIAASRKYGVIVIFRFCPTDRSFHIYKKAYLTTPMYAGHIADMQMADNRLFVASETHPRGTVFEFIPEVLPWQYGFIQRPVETNPFYTAPTISTADLDGNGDIEVVFASKDRGELFAYDIVNNNWQRNIIADIGVPIKDMVAGRFLSPFRQQVAVIYDQDQPIYLYSLQDGQKGYGIKQLTDQGNRFHEAGAVDIYQDGIDELLIGCQQGIMLISPIAAQ